MTCDSAILHGTDRGCISTNHTGQEEDADDCNRKKENCSKLADFITWSESEWGRQIIGVCRVNCLDELDRSFPWKWGRPIVLHYTIKTQVTKDLTKIQCVEGCWTYKLSKNVSTVLLEVANFPSKSIWAMIAGAQYNQGHEPNPRTVSLACNACHRKEKNAANTQLLNACRTRKTHINILAL